MTTSCTDTAEAMASPGPMSLPPYESWHQRIRQRLRRHWDNNSISYLLTLILLLFLLVALAPRIFISIPAGHLGVLYSRFGGGTDTSHVFQEGFHVIAPWDNLTLYNVRVQQTTLAINVLSREALPIKMSISIRYYPEKSILGFLHANVGPDYRDKIVIPEVVAVLRMTAGQFPAESLYSSPLPFEQAVNKSVEQIERKYVVLDGVNVKSIELPNLVEKAIEDKVQEQQLAQSYTYRIQCAQLEAQRKKIEATGIQQYNQTINATLNPNVLKWQGIEATKSLAQSKNAKVVVVGNGSKGMPIILGGE